jgi:transposase-like protein
MDADGPTTILKRDALGRVTLPREQREALIAEFERSGLRATQFARIAGINYGTFASWMQDRRHARGDYARSDRGEARVSPAVPLRLMEAVVAPSAAGLPAAPDSALEVLLPGGAKVLIANAE